MISHSNLADNLKLIVTGLGASSDTIVVSWLPQVKIPWPCPIRRIFASFSVRLRCPFECPSFPNPASPGHEQAHRSRRRIESLEGLDKALIGDIQTSEWLHFLFFCTPHEDITQQTQEIPGTHVACDWRPAFVDDSSALT